MNLSTLNDERHLRRALKLAARGQGKVEPNPMVGCVIARGGRIIGEGYHRRFGGPHAEVDALRRCSASPRGATVYVTLEPCCQHGKTPPCVDALLEAGVGRVVASLHDPNLPRKGGGFALLKRAGIRVDVGLLADEAAELNAPYFKLVRERRPWVILKWAQSLDGKIATRTGDSKWITDETCRAHAHRTRGRVDAILVGVGTVLQDDPLLTCRAGPLKRVATRIVLDSSLRTPMRSRLVRTARQTPTWLFCAREVSSRRVRSLEQAGCIVRHVRGTRHGLSLAAVLDTLGRQQMTNVLVEGGGALLGRFFDQGLADEFHVYVAPLLIGGRSAAGPLNAEGVRAVAGAFHPPQTARLKPLGAGYFLHTRGK